MHLVQTMAYAGEKPWHGIGNRLAAGQSIEEWRRQSGMDWAIEESEVRYITGNNNVGVINAFPEQKVLYRSDTKAPLAVVSKRFKVVQPGEILEFYRDLTAGNGFELETAGVLREGKKFWALARTGQSVTLKGRERDEVDLSKVVLTHHTLRKGAKAALDLRDGDPEKLPPIDAPGTGAVQDKDRVLLAEIIEKVNGLFEGQLTDNDQLVYVNGVIKGKLLENQTLIDQAASNEKIHFSNSPDLSIALMQALMDALEAHTAMSQQALASKKIQDGLKDILLGPGQLYELLRSRSGVVSHSDARQ